MARPFTPSPLFPFAQAKRDGLEAAAAEASRALNAIPGIGSGPMGLTPDAVKFSPAYRLARARYDKAAAELRAFAGMMSRNFPRELKAERDARRAEREARLTA
jgi:hypothetical protein